MKKSLHECFRIGLVAAMAYPVCGKNEEASAMEIYRKLARDDYFDAVELNPIPAEGLRTAAARVFADAHMAVCYNGQGRLLGGGLNPNALDEAERKRAEDALLLTVDEAVSLGAERVGFLAGKWSPDTGEQAYARLLKTARAVCAHAKGRGITVELEVFDHDVDKCALIGPAPLAARFAADMRRTCDNFGLMIDLSHIPMTREDSRFVVRALRPFITRFHIGNTVVRDPAAEGYGDLHPRFGFPRGENDLPQVLDFLRALRDEGFLDRERPYVLSFEVKPWGDEDPDVVLAGSKRVLNRAWALLED